MAAKLGEKGERLGKLEELRRRETELLEELARGGVKGVVAVQREIRRELENVLEHVVPDDRELTLEDVERWCATRFWKFASTMPANPHTYTLRYAGDDGMFCRVCLFVWTHGYANVFGGREFTQLDVGDHFLWTTQANGDGRDTSLTTLINAKPLSLLERRPPTSRWRPTKPLIARAAVRRLEVGEGLALSGAEVAVERVDGSRYRWVRGARSVEVDEDEATRRLAARKADELDTLRFGEAATQLPLGTLKTDGRERA